ncbi:MAG: mercuric reductase, partial [Nitrospirae bacterium]
LLYNAHPLNWKNPEPQKKYNLVVIGGGTAGLISAAAASFLGAKVALIEKHLLGGDCLNTGCVPSKAIIRSSRIVADIRKAHKYGIKLPIESVEIDFPEVMKRMRRLRARISEHDSAMRFSEMGVDVFFGTGRFKDKHTIEVDGKNLRFSKAIIATGSRAFHPEIEGIAEAGYLTNETVFSLTKKPERLAVIGGGPIGCELSQAFSRLGCKVVLLHKNAHILDREDGDAAEILQRSFIDEGIELILNCNIKKVEKDGSKKIIYFESQGVEDRVIVDEILVGVGRAPNVEDLNLEAVGIEYDTRRGIFVNDQLQTSNHNIYAAGDVCLKYKFTHTADATARIAVQNALFLGRKKQSLLTVPWCTYTDPEIAHVGMYERDAAHRGIKVKTFTKQLSSVDRAVLDGEEDGFVKIHTKAGTDKIIGATIVAPHAGEMINEITLAMVNNIGLKSISSTIHPYPTKAEAIRSAADLYNRTR